MNNKCSRKKTEAGINWHLYKQTVEVVYYYFINDKPFQLNNTKLEALT